MTKTETASEALARIEKRFFKGAGLKKACLKKGEERREYVLAQTERLLNDVQGCGLMATYLSDQFWTADDDRIPTRADMPLLTEEGLSELSKDESLKARLVKDVAGLCHDLVLHFDFDLKEYLSSKIKVFKGKKTEVCLKCKSKHMKAILDYFGHEIKTTNAEKGYFNAIIEIELSPTFYAWIFQFEGDIIIQSPQNAIDDFIKTAEMIIEVHSK